LGNGGGVDVVYMEEYIVLLFGITTLACAFAVASIGTAIGRVAVCDDIIAT
jgi:hypothetical protein